VFPPRRPVGWPSSSASASATVKASCVSVGACSKPCSIRLRRLNGAWKPTIFTGTRCDLGYLIDAVAVEIGRIGTRIGRIAALVGATAKYPASVSAGICGPRNAGKRRTRAASAPPSPDGDQTTPKKCCLSYGLLDHLPVYFHRASGWGLASTQGPNEIEKATGRRIVPSKRGPVSAEACHFSAPVRIGRRPTAALRGLPPDDLRLIGGGVFPDPRSTFLAVRADDG
jgi:hypothetical protein